MAKRKNYGIRKTLFREYVIEREYGAIDTEADPKIIRAADALVDLYLAHPHVYEWIDIRSQANRRDIVGFLVIGNKETAHDTADKNICDIYIRPAFRGMGLASRLLKEVLQSSPRRYSLQIAKGNNLAKDRWTHLMKNVGFVFCQIPAEERLSDMDEMRWFIAYPKTTTLKKLTMYQNAIERSIRQSKSPVHHPAQAHRPSGALLSELNEAVSLSALLLAEPEVS